MARRGRKRKTGKRYKSGDLRPERGEDINLLAQRMPHRAAPVIYVDFKYTRKIIERYVPAEEAHSQECTTPLGRFWKIGAISEDQYQAGCRFALQADRARRATGARKMRPSIAGFGQPSSAAPEFDADIARIWIMDYVRASEAMYNSSGTPSICGAVVRTVTIEERSDLHPGLFKFLFVGLERLANHYEKENKRG